MNNISGANMSECEDCKKIEVCNTCGEKICRMNHSKVNVCKIVGYFNENGDLVCERCHKK